MEILPPFEKMTLDGQGDGVPKAEGRPSVFTDMATALMLVGGDKLREDMDKMSPAEAPAFIGDIKDRMETLADFMEDNKDHWFNQRSDYTAEDCFFNDLHEFVSQTVEDLGAGCLAPRISSSSEPPPRNVEAAAADRWKELGAACAEEEPRETLDLNLLSVVSYPLDRLLEKTVEEERSSPESTRDAQLVADGDAGAPQSRKERLLVSMRETFPVLEPDGGTDVPFALDEDQRAARLKFCREQRAEWIKALESDRWEKWTKRPPASTDVSDQSGTTTPTQPSVTSAATSAAKD